MPTSRPRFSLSLDEDLLSRVTEFQKKAHYIKRNDAIIALMEIGLESYYEDKGVAEKHEARRRLDNLRYDSHTRALLEASEGMTARQIDHMTTYAKFLRRENEPD